MSSVKHHTHADGQRNELQNWSMEKLAAHPAGAALYQGRYWLYTVDNRIYYSPDGVNIKPLTPISAQGLQPPKIIIDTKQQPVDLQEDSEASGSIIAATARNRVRVHCDAFPDEVYLLSGLYLPRLELMWYSVQGQRYWYTRGGTRARSGWKHPDDLVDGPNYTDGWKGGGSPSYNNAGTVTRRRSEWKISSRADLIDVTQACVGRLTLHPRIYVRDNTGNLVQMKAVVPIDCRSKNRLTGSRKAWGGNVRDARVAFRVSIVDPNALKPTRLFGPMSEQLRVGSLEHPFVPDVPFPIGGGVFWPTAKQNPAWQHDQISISFGERLP